MKAIIKDKDGKVILQIEKDFINQEYLNTIYTTIDENFNVVGLIQSDSGEVVIPVIGENVELID